MTKYQRFDVMLLDGLVKTVERLSYEMGCTDMSHELALSQLDLEAAIAEVKAVPKERRQHRNEERRQHRKSTYGQLITRGATRTRAATVYRCEPCRDWRHGRCEGNGCRCPSVRCVPKQDLEGANQ